MSTNQRVNRRNEFTGYYLLKVGMLSKRLIGKGLS